MGKLIAELRPALAGLINSKNYIFHIHHHLEAQSFQDYERPQQL